MATSLGEGKLWIQTYKTPLKNWSCVASCMCRGVGIYIYTYIYICTHPHICMICKRILYR